MQATSADEIEEAVVRIARVTRSLLEPQTEYMIRETRLLTRHTLRSTDWLNNCIASNLTLILGRITMHSLETLQG